jgi:hypothetical protein
VCSWTIGLSLPCPSVASSLPSHQSFCVPFLHTSFNQFSPNNAPCRS